MTTRDQARRGSAESRLRFGAGERDRDDLTSAGPALPERLAAARERKGVDLGRAERETKIRVRYLSALERGDYRDLPGAVYTKGFLRNYALYLGLDPEDVLRQWRRERGDQASPEPVMALPRPIEAPARPLNFSPTVVVAAIMTAGVVLFAIYLGAQLLRYARPPELAVTNPATAVFETDEAATTFRLSGTATAGSTVTIRTAGRPDLTVPVLATGEWSTDVDLRRGDNQFVISARNDETGKTAEQPRTIVIRVPYLVIQAPQLTVATPVEGTTYENGAIPVEGTAANAKSVTVSAQYLGPVGATSTPAPAVPPTPTPSQKPGATSAPSTPPAPSQPPPGTTVTVGEDGAFSLPLELTAGRWAITITATSDEGKTASLTRQVTVAFKGVNLVVAIKGTSAWIKVWVDGALVGDQSGRVYASGKTLTFTGQHTIEVRSGSSGSTYFTLNGVSLGTLGKSGVPETWLFAPPAAPVRTQRQ